MSGVAADRMRACGRRHIRLLIAALTAIVALAGGLTISLAGPNPATGDGLSQLESELGSNSAKQSTIEGAVQALSAQISKLDGQIALVQRRATQVQAAVTADEQQVAADKAAIAVQRRQIVKLKARLALADRVLAAELVGRYEQPQQSIVSVVIDANGFQQMLEQLQYMRSANAAEQRIITATRAARDRSATAERRLTQIEGHDQRATQHALTEARAVAGMQSLLNSRRAALGHAEAARAAALLAIKQHGRALHSQIATARRQEQAAQRAAEQTQAPSSPGATSAPTGSGGGGGGDSSVDIYNGWAIPEPIVMCESGGQNDPPNSAGASGYYQIIPSTWVGEGGTGPAAYLASRAEQDRIASKLWNGGRGASDWVCAGIVGIN